MTDEEILKMIDFWEKRDYAVAHSGGVTEDEKAAYRAEKERIEKIVQDVNGISGDETVEIARKQLEADFGDAANSLELMTDCNGSILEAYRMEIAIDGDGISTDTFYYEH